VLGDRLREAIEAEPITTCEGEIVVTISVGVTIMDDADHDLAAILNRADSALYEAKRAGRNCVRVVPESAAEPEAKAA
jgi:diguanylate cyclase (GGDEF)-like protein